MNTKALTPDDYAGFLAAMKERVLGARTSAARSVNRELVLLYWDIGQGIALKQQTAGWGDAVVSRLAADLRAEFPDMSGFSVANLWRMQQLYLEYNSAGFLSRAVREMKLAKLPSEKLSQRVRELVAAVPWGHHANALAKLTDPAARLYYLNATARFGWSRKVLQTQIKAGAYERAVLERKTHNFPLALPDHLAEQAAEMMKSRYNLEFLGIGVAKYRLQAHLPLPLKGRLPTARQLATALPA